MPYEIVMKSVIAGVLASFACGLGVIPLMFRGVDPARHTGLGYALAGGLMFAASVYNLILPGLTMQSGSPTLPGVIAVVGGLLAGALFLSQVEKRIDFDGQDTAKLAGWGGRAGLLIFVAMAVHSIPEGVAVGVGYASSELHNTELGTYLAVAIGIHNIPEGLAVAIPMRSAGASINYCFWAAVLTSIPQPIAAIPASIASWFFQPLMPIMMGFAAGAMIFLVLIEMIPGALEASTASRTAWAFLIGFCLMILIQTLL